MTLDTFIKAFLNIEYDDKIYLTIIDKNKGDVVISNERLFNICFEPYKDSYIHSVIEVSECYHYIVTVYKR